MKLQAMQATSYDPSERVYDQRKILAIAIAWGINTLAYSIVYPFLPIYLHTILWYSYVNGWHHVSCHGNCRNYWFTDFRRID